MPAELRFWLAGYLEGEGSFIAGSPSQPRRPGISAQTTDKDVATLVAELLGVSVMGPYKQKQEHHKHNLAVRATGTRAGYFMRALRPLMSARRQHQIDRALAALPDENGSARRGLTQEQADEIRTLAATGGHRQTELAARFGTSPSTVRDILSGKRYNQQAAIVSAVLRHDPSTPSGYRLAVYWLAGIIEGEGCIVLPRPDRPSHVRLQVNMTDADTIGRVADLLGAKVHIREAQQEHWSSTCEVTRKGIEAARWLRTLRPLLGERRRAKADEALRIFNDSPLTKPNLTGYVADDFVPVCGTDYAYNKGCRCEACRECSRQRYQRRKARVAAQQAAAE